LWPEKELPSGLVMLHTVREYFSENLYFSVANILRNEKLEKSCGFIIKKCFSLCVLHKNTAGETF